MKGGGRHSKLPSHFKLPVRKGNMAGSRNMGGVGAQAHMVHGTYGMHAGSIKARPPAPPLARQASTPAP